MLTVTEPHLTDAETNGKTSLSAGCESFELAAVAATDQIRHRTFHAQEFDAFVQWQVAEDCRAKGSEKE